MPNANLLDALPLWGLFGVTVAFVLLSIEAGHRLGRRRNRPSENEKAAPVGTIVGATLALLGLMLAFTFSQAATRFDERRRIVVDEANTIGTTQLRAGLLPNNRGVPTRKLLREYVQARLEAAKTGDIDKVLRQSEQIHRQLWSEAEALGLEQPNSIMVGLYIQSLNEMIDIHSKRVLVSLRSRLPGILWVTLYLITMLAMAGVGYQEGLSDSKRSWTIVVLVLVFSSIIALIADLDSPVEGFLKVSQEAMIDLQK